MYIKKQIHPETLPRNIIHLDHGEPRLQSSHQNFDKKLTFICFYYNDHVWNLSG